MGLFCKSSRLFTSHAGIAVLGLAAMAGSACKSDYPASGRAQGTESKSQARQVRTVPVVQTPIGETVTVNGTLAAYDQTTVGMKVAGRLQMISVDLGTVVRKGQAIARPRRVVTRWT